MALTNICALAALALIASSLAMPSSAGDLAFEVGDTDLPILLKSAKNEGKAVLCTKNAETRLWHCIWENKEAAIALGDSEIIEDIAEDLEKRPKCRVYCSYSTGGSPSCRVKCKWAGK